MLVMVHYTLLAPARTSEPFIAPLSQLPKCTPFKAPRGINQLFVLPGHRCQTAPSDLNRKTRAFLQKRILAPAPQWRNRPDALACSALTGCALGRRLTAIGEGDGVSILEHIFSRIEGIAGRVKHDVTSALQTHSAIDYTLAAVYTERTGKTVNYSVWFSHDAIEALDRTPEARDAHFVDETTIGALMDGKWVRRTCESKQDAIRFERHLRDGCYLTLITLLSPLCK
jgi:hypothetical protein